MTDELDAREKVTIETAYAMDDSCQMQFWARGHHSWGAFTEAVMELTRAEGRTDLPWWVIRQAPVRNLYQRAVPCRDSIVSDTRFVHSETKGRGSYPVTVMDFWFPLFQARSRQ